MKIIAPKHGHHLFNIGDCSGECSFPLSDSVSPTSHAIAKSMVRFLYFSTHERDYYASSKHISCSTPLWGNQSIMGGAINYAVKRRCKRHSIFREVCPRFEEFTELYDGKNNGIM